MARSDEEIIYDAYLRLGQHVISKAKKNIPAREDIRLINGISNKVPRQLVYLNEMIMLTTEEIKKRVHSVKGMYVQLCTVWGRNPNCVPKTLRTEMDTLIRAVSRHEANLLELVRLQETGGDRIDLEEIFSNKANVNKLGGTMAMTIVRDVINHANSTSVGKPKDELYITATGKKYHTRDCPYCKGRILTAASKAMIENQKMIPCVCIARKKEADKSDHSYITAFIDESIHPIRWNEEGNVGKAGSYSYIAVWGNLASERDITDERVIAKGVEGLNEINHIERLSEAAIGKVMFLMLYDFGFTGHLQIFTDNMAAMENWTKNGRNSKLAVNFESVTVSFIPREENTMADKLGRTRMIINIPTAEYSGIVTKCNSYDRLRGEMVKVELEKHAAMKAKLAAENKTKELEIQLEQYRSLAEKKKFIPNWFSKIKAFFKAESGYELQGNN